MHTPVTAALDALGIPYRLFRHAGKVESLEQAAAERGQKPSQVVRSILFRLGDCELPGQDPKETAPDLPAESRGDCFLMVLAAGPQQISWPALRRLTGQRRLTMASPEEVLAVTGYPIGAVSPLGLPVRLAAVYIDESLCAEQEVSLGSGVRGQAVILRTDDLLRALPGAEIVDLRD